MTIDPSFGVANLAASAGNASHVVASAAARQTYCGQTCSMDDIRNLHCGQDRASRRIEMHFNRSAYTLAEVIKIADEQIPMGQSYGPEWPELKAAVQAVASWRNAPPDVNRLALWMRGNKGRMVGNWRFVTAKHGLIDLAKVVAKEGTAHGVRANVICPGFVRTPLVDKQIPEQAEELGISEQEVIKNVMLKETVDGEFTTVDDVAQTALFLASFGSNALTGQSIVVSHGWFMQ